MLHAYGIESEFNYTIIRPFNFIGPKIDFLSHEKPGTPRVFSCFMNALLNGTPMKLVNGGTARRCYTYIDDAIECTYRIIENPRAVCDRQIFNIGAPKNEVSIRDMAELMREIYVEEFHHKPSELPAVIDIAGDDFYGHGYDDSDRRIPDITKARELLAWEPAWGLRDLLKATMRYYVSATAGACGLKATSNG